MKKKRIASICLSLFVLSIFVSSSMSQPIELKKEDVPGKLATTFRMMKIQGPTVDLKAPGEDVIWDFTSYQSDEIETWEVVEAVTSPYIERFPTANLIYKLTRAAHDTVSYNFIESNDSALTELGQVSLVGETITDSLILLNPDPRFYFPVKYGDSWITRRPLTMNVLGADLPVMDSSYYKVDAHGILKCALGDIPCLRVYQHEITTVYLALASFVVQDVINYYWVANEYGILANIYGENEVTDPNYTEASHAYFMLDFTTKVEHAHSSGTAPAEFKLLANYPNPFNPSTQIEYWVPQSADVSLRVFNSLGQEVAQLFNGRRMAGHYRTDWNARNLPSGQYFIRLGNGNQTLTQSCILLK